MVDLSIIIVSWNVRDLLRHCLASVVREKGLVISDWDSSPNPQSLTTNHFTLEIIVVDNASTDGSAAMVRDEFPAVRLVASERNLGYPGGNNVGLRMAQGRYLMILNPDTQVHPGALAAMVAYADAHPDVGVVGPQLLNPDGSVQSSRRRFPTFATALFESTWLQPLAPRRLLERYYVLDQPDDVTLDVDWVDGAALMARREAVEQVGLLDEGFFMYSEELDWCRRFRQAGWRVVYLPEAKIVHHRGKSSDQVVVARHVHFNTSKVRYFRKHHGALAAETLRLFLLGSYAWQLGLEGAKWLLGHKRLLRAQRLAAYWQVLRSGLREASRR